MVRDEKASSAEIQRAFIAINPYGVKKGLIREITTCCGLKGFKLVTVKILVPPKDFAKKHDHDHKDRPFLDALCDFLSFRPVIAMVWEGKGVINYGRKLIGATDSKRSEPGTISDDIAVVVGRNIINGSDGPETAKNETSLLFKPEELVPGELVNDTTEDSEDDTSNTEKSAGPRLYHCLNCKNQVARSDDVMSKEFFGKCGRAFLFWHAMNVVVGEKEDREFYTGKHSVADISCYECEEVLGWMYVRAYPKDQKYKEGKFVLERTKIAKN